MHILIVEDDPVWLTALGRLYRVWFPRASQSIAHGAAEARRTLRHQTIDLVSLDLNLSKAPQAELEPHGLNLLSDIARHHLARAVCIITLAQVDWHLRSLLRSAGEIRALEQLRICPHHSLKRFFGVNGIILHKLPERSADENVGLFLDAVDAGQLRDLLAHAFVLSFSGDGCHEPLEAHLQCVGGKAPLKVTLTGPDARLLEKIAQARKSGGKGKEPLLDWVTDTEVAEIYGRKCIPGGSDKYVPIHSLKRRLAKAGVVGLDLLWRVRSETTETETGPWAKPGGWRLNPQVSVRGAAAKREHQLRL